MFFRRLLVPALVAVPVISWIVTPVFRFESFQWEFPGVGDLALGLLLNSIGIVIACWPAERLFSQYAVGPVAKLPFIVLAGAVGGFFMGAILAAFAWQAGLLGMLPGAVVALVWVLFNFDLLARKKDTHLG